MDKKNTDSSQTQQQHHQLQAKSKLMKKEINYSSVTCGAKIVQANPESQNPSFILYENKDQYMNNPCFAKKGFVVELCESVQIQLLELGNLEFFSSLPETFDIHISERFPTKDWVHLGTYHAREERVVQSFRIESGPTTYVKYIRIDIVSHYGNEHFCPLSILRVFGVSMDDDEEVEMRDDEVDHADIIDDNAADDNAKQQQQPNLFKKATDYTCLLNTSRYSHQLDENSSAINDNNNNSNHPLLIALTLGELNDTFQHKMLYCSWDFRCLDVIYKSAALLLWDDFCRYYISMVAFKPSSSSSSSTSSSSFLTCPMLIPASSSSSPSSSTKDEMINSLDDVNIVNDSNYAAAISSETITSNLAKTTIESNSHSYDIHHRHDDDDKNDNIADEDRKLPALESNDKIINSDDAVLSVADEVFKDDENLSSRLATDQITPTSHDKIECLHCGSHSENIKDDHQNVITAADDNVPSSSIGGGSVSDSNASLRDETVGVQQQHHDSNEHSKHSTQQRQTVDKDAVATHTTTTTTTTSTTATHKQQNQQQHQQQQQQQHEHSNADSTSDSPSSSSSQSSPPSLTSAKLEPLKDYELASDGSVDEITYHKLPSKGKESIFVKLRNRVKHLEDNLNLTNTYLEELSQSYKKQSEEMYTSLNKTISKLINTAKSAEDRDLKQQDRIQNLEIKFANQSILISVIQKQLQDTHSQVVERHLLMMFIEFTMFLLLLSYFYNYKCRNCRLQLQPLDNTECSINLQNHTDNAGTPSTMPNNLSSVDVDISSTSNNLNAQNNCILPNGPNRDRHHHRHHGWSSKKYVLTLAALEKFERFKLEMMEKEKEMKKKKKEELNKREALIKDGPNNLPLKTYAINKDFYKLVPECSTSASMSLCSKINHKRIKTLSTCENSVNGVNEYHVTSAVDDTDNDGDDDNSEYNSCLDDSCCGEIEGPTNYYPPSHHHQHHLCRRRHLPISSLCFSSTPKKLPGVLHGKDCDDNPNDISIGDIHHHVSKSSTVSSTGNSSVTDFSTEQFSTDKNHLENGCGGDELTNRRHNSSRSETRHVDNELLRRKRQCCFRRGFHWASCVRRHHVRHNQNMFQIHF
ncbi:hypothetical protein HELRODRAFT_193623 [Helobdella robusta]|uniref:SUN domain-containing protein n=1 Tax=Helobdella robusta TaxID=6412 RepID=T1FV70_HELRO|nr:hypothetical protein HELRODRAFT_193623 [Helobdella robusta]ESN95295.1 hypothetical protein HELRODRAFT_193623 [Helobdella robusta]